MPILPIPAKDEFALGFIGRLCHINLVNSSEMMRGLLSHYGLKSERGAYLEVLALLAGKDQRDFVMAHTIAPAMLMGGRVFNGLLGGSWYRRIGDERNPLKLARKQAYFCPRCLEQQRHDLGFTFWHRVHQIPGIFWCPWHRTVLLGSHGSVVKRTLPSFDLAQPEQAPITAEHFRNPVLQYFSEIMMGFLVQPEHHYNIEFSFLLRRRAIELGLGVDVQSTPGWYLSDIANDACPAWWLNDVFWWGGKVAGGYFKPIDDALSTELASARTYALAIALMFTPDEWQSLGIKAQSN